MIILQTEFFKIDLSNLNVSFTEENNVFEGNLIKRYSFPFEIPFEDRYASFFLFLQSHNSAEVNNYIDGILTLNDKYHKAELVILSTQEKVSVVIYYDYLILEGFNQKLKDLNWGTVPVGDDIYDFAEQTILEDYPDTKINFPKIYTPNLNESHSAYEYTPSGINYKKENNDFQETFDGKGGGISTLLGDSVISFKTNEMRPYLYLKEVVSHLFSELGLLVSGDFITNPIIEKCLLYHQNEIYFKNTDPIDIDEDFIHDIGDTSQVVFDQTILLNDQGYYQLYFNLKVSNATPNTVLTVATKFSFELFTRQDFVNIDGSGNCEQLLEYELNLLPSLVGENVHIQVRHPNGSIADLSECIISLIPNKRPIYKGEIELKDLLPDMTVNNFLIALKESFDIDTTFDLSSNTVNLNFFKTYTKNATIIDLSKFAIRKPSRIKNNKTGINVEYKDGEVIAFDKVGSLLDQQIGFESKSFSIQPLKLIDFEGKWTAHDQSGLSFLFFQSNDYAESLHELNGVSLSRSGFINQFLFDKLFQELNGEDYELIVILPIHLSVKVRTDVKLWMYQNYYLVKKIDRQSVNSLFEKLKLKLLKVKDLS